MHFFSIPYPCYVLIAMTITLKSTAAGFLFVHPQRASVPASRHCCSIASSLSSGADDDSRREYDTVAIANHTFRLPTSENLQTIQERQVFHAIEPEQVFCVSSSLCRHGYPQAFGFHPTRGPKFTSGLFRLSCPLLCEAVDAYEGEGGVRQMSDWLRTEDIKDKGDNMGWKRKGYQEANNANKEVRQELAHNDRDKLVTSMGEYNADAFMRSGVAGIPPDQTFNVKCVHAHVADHLCRRGPLSSGSDGHNNSALGNQRNPDEVSCANAGDGNNIIGKYALHILEERGVPINGSNVCWQQCNANHQRTPSDWSYLAKKNRVGLRRRGSNSKMRNFQSSLDQ